MDRSDAFSKRWEIASEFGREKIVTAEVRHILSQKSIPPERVEEVATAVGEACLNALEHGNGLRRERIVDVRMDMHEKDCTFRIYDEGSGFDYDRACMSREAKRLASDPRGWGLLFISSFADRFRVGQQAGRFYVELHFCLEP